jgi:predicted acetyltransferase
MQEIKLELVGESNRLAFNNLFNLYHHDLSVYIPDMYSFVNEDGFYDRNATDKFFDNSNSLVPYIIRCDEKIAGLLVFSRPPFVKPGCDYCIQELFVLNNYRGKGIAEEACKVLFNENSGRYCALVITNNIRAMKFWKNLIVKNATLISQEKYTDEICTAFEFVVKDAN